MSRAAITVATMAIALAACSKDKESESKLQRSGGQAAVVLVGAGEPAAGLAQELEPNNEPSQAQVVALGGGATGRLDGSLDVDRYLLTSEEEGQLYVLVDGAEDADLKLTLQKADGTVLAASDRGPAGTAEGVAGYWLQAQTEYQLEVSEFTKKKLRKSGGRAGVSAPYHLRVTFESSPRPDFEVEPNEDLEGAREVGVGQQARGYLGWAGDTDWWRIPVSGFAEVETGAGPEASASPRQALNLVVSGIVNVATVMELTTASGELVAMLEASVGNEVAMRSFIPDVAADFYIVKLRAKRSNPEESYQIRLDASALASGHEVEPNNTIESASAVASEVGVLSHVSGELCLGDVDMFALEPAAMNRSLDLRLEGPMDADLNISVITERGEVLAQSEKPGLGLNEILESVNVAPNTSPVVILRAAKVAMPAGYKLALSVSEGQGTPQVPVPAPTDNPDLME